MRLKRQVRKTSPVIVMEPVLEVLPTEGFTLWPVARVGSYGFLPLSGELTPAEVGTAVMGIARWNDTDPEHDGRPPRPTDPLGAFLHGLLTHDNVFAAGGMRVTDRSTGVTLLPGCCNGLEDWREWYEVADGHGRACFGHDPGPCAERLAGTVRLTVDVERSDSPVIELSVAELRRLLDDAGQDLADFHALAAAWVSAQLPDVAAPVAAALALAMPVPDAPTPWSSSYLR